MNRVELSGEIVTNVSFSHSHDGIDFYIFSISSMRPNGLVDTIPCFAPKELARKLTMGNKVHIVGEIMTRNKTWNGKRRLFVALFAKEIRKYECDINRIVMHGFTCQEISLRKTLKGKNVCNFIFACNRNDKKGDYIPCVSWGDNAKKISRAAIGKEMELYGKIRSRKYTKKIENGEETRTVYEVFVYGIDFLEEECEQ